MSANVFYVLYLIFIYEAGGSIVLRGTRKVKELIGKLKLKCVFEESRQFKYSNLQLRIQNGDKVLARLYNGSNVEVISDKEWNINATGTLGNAQGKSFLSITIENLAKGPNRFYTCTAVAVGQTGKVKHFTSSPFKITITSMRKSEMRAYLANLIRNYQQELQNLNHILKTMNINKLKLANDREALKLMQEKVAETLRVEHEKTIEELKSLMADKKDVDDLKSSFADKREISELKSTLVRKNERHDLNIAEDLRIDLDKLKTKTVAKREFKKLKSQMVEKNEFEKLKSKLVNKNVLDELNSTLVDKKELGILNSVWVDKTELNDLKTTMADGKDLDSLKANLCEKKEFNQLKLVMAEKKEVEEIESNFVDKKEVDDLKLNAVGKKEIDELNSIAATKNDVMDLLLTFVEKKELEKLRLFASGKHHRDNLKSIFVEREEFNSFHSTVVDKEEMENFKRSMASKNELYSLNASVFNALDTDFSQKNQFWQMRMAEIKLIMAGKQELENLDLYLQSSVGDDNVGYGEKLNRRIQEMSENSDNVDKRLGDLKGHSVEMGSFDCDGRDKDGQTTKFKETSVTFRTPFTKPPTKIWIGLKSMDVQGHVRVSANHKSVTKGGLVAVCGTWYDGYLNSVSFNWLAFE